MRIIAAFGFLIGALIAEYILSRKWKESSYGEQINFMDYEESDDQ